MDYEPRLRSEVLDRCLTCEWSCVADDSEFPSEFVFDLLYETQHGERVLRAIRPQAVLVSDSRGNPLYQHAVTEQERPRIWEWLQARMRLQQAQFLEEMSQEIDRDCASRSESTRAVFTQLRSESRQGSESSSTFGRRFG